MKVKTFFPSFLALAAALSVSLSALAVPICEGEYNAAIGSAIPPAVEAVTGVPAPVSHQQVSVEVKDCGRTLIIHGDSSVPLTRDEINPAHYFGTFQGAPVTYDVWSHDRLTGQVVIPGANAGVIYDMTLIGGHAPDFEECDTPVPAGKDTDADRLTIDPELRREAIEIVADQLGVPHDKAERYISAQRSVAKTRQSDEGVTEILPGEPGCPIELTGVKTCPVFPPDTTTIVETNVLLDEDGRLLPVTTEGSASNRLRVDDPSAADFCAPEATYPPADKRIKIKFLAIEEDSINDVQALLVDADTNYAKKAHYATGKHTGSRGRIDAADEAYQAIGAPVTGWHK